MPVPPAGTALAGGTNGPRALRPFLDTVLDALTTGAEHRAGPLPSGGPATVTRAVRDACHPLLPDHGTGPHTALRTLVHTLAAGAADPADPHCAAHLHCPPLALATAADLAAGALNPSMDSWDQAPAASALEALTSRALAALVYPRATEPDALITTGGTESNQLALLLAREAAAPDGSATEPHRPARPLQVVCGANAHHSIHRSAWLLGLPEPLTLPTPDGILTPDTVHTCLANLAGRTGPVLLTATAGTTDSGAIDPLPALADIADHHGARFHIDAAYGGALLFSDTHRSALHGLARAHTVSLDLHKLGWQPVAAGLLAVPGPATLAPSPTRPTTSTPTTTPKPASPTCSAAHCAPPAAPTSSRSPSPSRPSAATASANSSTAPSPPPRPSPTSSRPTPATNSTPAPSSARSSSAPPAPTTPPSPPSAAPSSPTDRPSSAGPPPPPASGSKPLSSTPTPNPET